MAASKKVNTRKSLVDHALEVARKARANAVNVPKKPVAVKGKKTVPAALDWGKGIPEDKLAYLNDEEMALLQAHRMFKGKRSYNGIPAFPDAEYGGGSYNSGYGTGATSSTGSGTSTSWGGSSSSGYGSQNVSGSSLNTASNNNGYGGSSGSGGSSSSGGVGTGTGGGGTSQTQGQGGSGSGPVEGGGGSAPSASTSDTSTSSSTAPAADTSTEEYKAPQTATGPTSMPVNAPQPSSMPPGFQYGNPLPDNYGMTYNPSEQAVANSIASGTSISEGYPSQKIQDRVPADPNRMTISEVVNLSQTPTVPEQIGLAAATQPKAIDDRLITTNGVTREVPAANFAALSPEDQAAIDAAQQEQTYNSLGMIYDPSITMGAPPTAQKTISDSVPGSSGAYSPVIAQTPNSITIGKNSTSGYDPLTSVRPPTSYVPAGSYTGNPPPASQQPGLGGISPAESQALYGMDLSDIPMPTGKATYNTDPRPGPSTAITSTPASPVVIYSGYADENLAPTYANAIVGNQYGYPGINNTPTIGNKNVNVSGSGYPVVSASTYASPNLSSQSTADVFGNTTGFPRNASPLSRSVANSGPPGMTPNSALPPYGIPGFSSPLPPNSGMTYNPNIPLAAPVAAAPNIPAAPWLGQSAVPSNQAVYSPPGNQFVNSAKPYNERLITTPDGVTHEVTQEQMQQLSPEDQYAISAANQNITYTPASASPTVFNDTSVRKTVNPYNGDDVDISNVDPYAPPTAQYIGQIYPGDETRSAYSQHVNEKGDIANSDVYIPDFMYTTPRERRIQQYKKLMSANENQNNGQSPLPEYVPYDYLQTGYGIPVEPDPDIIAFNNYSNTLKRGGRVGNSIDAALRIARQHKSR